MKKKLIFALTTLSIFSLSGCVILPNTSSTQGDSSLIDPSYERVKSKYTYKDYADYNVYGNDYCPTIGNPKLLVIPVWFTDSSNYINLDKKESVRNDIALAYTGTPSETGWHSVSSFYQEESKGKCQLTANISEWYECGYESTAFYAGENTTVELVKMAEAWYFRNHPNDSRTNYDYDHNGYLDGLMLIYGAPDYVAMQKNSAKNLWAYCYWTGNYSGKSSTNPVAQVFFWASYDFMYSSGRRASLATGMPYGNGDNTNCTIDAHTYIHEMGHVFGLVDYYDYSDHKYCPAGGISMQDYNITGHDPYSMIAFGWADPIVPKETTTIEIEPFQNNHDVVLLSPNYTGSPFDEYVLVEFYTPTGLNEFDANHKYSGLPKAPRTSGIRVWHVDARLGYYVIANNTWVPDYPTVGVEPNKGRNAKCAHAISNSFDEPNYGSPYGQFNEKFQEYNLLHLIRNNHLVDNHTTDYLVDTDLFVSGSTFSIESFNNQFVENNALDSGYRLGWSFKIDTLTNAKARITFTNA